MYRVGDEVIVKYLRELHRDAQLFPYGNTPQVIENADDCPVDGIENHQCLGINGLMFSSEDVIPVVEKCNLEIARR